MKAQHDPLIVPGKRQACGGALFELLPDARDGSPACAPLQRLIHAALFNPAQDLPENSSRRRDEIVSTQYLIIVFPLWQHEAGPS
jgi:hypothetical protein